MDLSHCYLHTLGDVEAGKLAELRARLPDIFERTRAASEEAESKEKLTIWGVSLNEESDASNIVLLKFLRAEDLNVDKAAGRLLATLRWRYDCCIDTVAASELPDGFSGHDTIGGADKLGRPVLVSRFGGMDLQKVFGNTEVFVRYRAKIMEQAVQQLSFKKGEPEVLCQVHDYTGVPVLFQTSEVKGSVTAVTKVFGDHYPEIKGMTIFLNFPSAFSGLWKAFCVFIPERTRKKFLILGEGAHAELFTHVGPEVLPEGVGGMIRTPPGPLNGPCELVTVAARDTKEVVMLEVPTPAKGTWELRVCNFEVAYEVVFVPTDGPEQVIAKSEPGQYLEATAGIVSGSWSADKGGCLKCRFKNERAWFRSRLCVCRAGVC